MGHSGPGPWPQSSATACCASVTIPSVPLAITLTKPPATDLGYLLHKSPDRVHSRELAFVPAHVFNPEATTEPWVVSQFESASR